VPVESWDLPSYFGVAVRSRSITLRLHKIEFTTTEYGVTWNALWRTCVNICAQLPRMDDPQSPVVSYDLLRRGNTISSNWRDATH
jgi:hypothetical protein